MMRASRQTTFRARVERLEDRTVPSFLPIGNEFQVNQTTTGDQIDPAIAAAPDGHLVVVYATPAYDNISPDPLVARIFNADGTPASGEIAVNQTSLIGSGGIGGAPQPAYPPQVAMDAQGDFVITWVGWTQMNGGQVAVLARRFDASGTPLGDQFRVSGDPLFFIERPVVAMDSQGGFAVGWQEDPGNGPDVFGRLYDATGTPLAAPFQIAQTTTAQTAIAVAMDSGGDSLFTWTDPDVFAQRYNAAGVAQGSAFQVNQNATNVQDTPGVAVAMDAVGDSVIAWVSEGHNAIHVRRFDALGQAASDEGRASNIPYNVDLVDPHAAMNASGAFLITWANAANSPAPNPDSLDVFAELYDAAGADHSGEFFVNQSRPASHPGVAIDAAGDFAFAWQSSAQDGDGAGILARRYIVNSTGYDAQPANNLPGRVVLTITIPYSNNAFEFSTATPANPAGSLGGQIYTLNGVAQVCPDYTLAQTLVNASGDSNTAVIVSGETVSLGNHGAAVIGGPYLQMTGFDTAYAYLSAPAFGLLMGTPGVLNAFHGLGAFSYMDSGSAFYQISGAGHLYAYSAFADDQASYSDGSGPSLFIASGTAYSSMSGTDQGQSFFNEAVGFKFNYAIAVHGSQDTAAFYDSPGNDNFVGTTTYSYLASNDASGNIAEYDEARDFGQVYAYSFVGGTDYAYNYDPQHVHTSGFIVLT